MLVSVLLINANSIRVDYGGLLIVNRVALDTLVFLKSRTCIV